MHQQAQLPQFVHLSNFVFKCSSFPSRPYQFSKQPSPLFKQQPSQVTTSAPATTTQRETRQKEIKPHVENCASTAKPYQYQCQCPSASTRKFSINRKSTAVSVLIRFYNATKKTSNQNVKSQMKIQPCNATSIPLEQTMGDIHSEGKINKEPSTQYNQRGLYSGT